MQPITAHSWILMDYKTKSYIRGHNILARREIASLTKMYTLYSTLLINELLSIDPKSCYVRVFNADAITGTTASLANTKYILVEDLYYGMMLPSGNDAAWILAVYYGYWLCENDKLFVVPRKRYKKQDLSTAIKYTALYISRFMLFVNKTLVKDTLNHSNTKFDNPHGLSSKFHYSNSYQVCQSAILFLSNKYFSQIVNTITHQGSYEGGDTFTWHNTNILLLKEHYYGVKTGQTATAGNCLCAYRIKNEKNGVSKMVTVVLGCDKAQDRFSDTQKIYQFHDQYLKMIE